VIEFAFDTVKDEVPVTIRFPLLVMLPADAVAASVPLIVEAPRFSAMEFTRITLFPLVIDTAPVKLLPRPSVMLFPAPAASVVVPVTLSTPVCVIAPPAVTFKFPKSVSAERFSARVSTTVTF